MPEIIFYFSMDFPFSPQGKNVCVKRQVLWVVQYSKYKQMGFIFLGSKITADDDCSHEIKKKKKKKKNACSLEEKLCLT